MRDGWSEEGLREMNVHGPEVREFYRFWTNFKTKKNFEWIQKYAYNPAELHAQNLRCVHERCSRRKWNIHIYSKDL
jgi:hypothetical protein